MKALLKIAAAGALALGIFTTSNVKAQTQMGVGLTAGVPTKTGYSFALGGDVKVQFKAAPSLWIPIAAGYQYNFFKDKIGDKSGWGYVPVKAGAKYFFSGADGLYGEALLGAGISTEKNGTTNFLYQPALGYAWDNGLDLQLKYEGLAGKNDASFGIIGLRIAYGFPL